MPGALRSMIAMFSSHAADASACTERRSTSQPSSPDSASASRKSTTASGSSASCTMISDSRSRTTYPANPQQPVRPEVVTHVLGTLCYPCVRSGQSATSGSGVAPARVTAARRFAPPFEGHHARLENGVAFAGSFDEFPMAASESRSVRSTGPLLAFPPPEYFRTCR